MKRIFTLLSGAAILTLGLSGSFAQTQEFHWCGTDKVNAQILKEHPEYHATIAQLEKYTEEYTARQEAAKMAPGASNLTGTVYTITVVFHVLHQGGTENISDAQIKSAIDILNEDFRKKNKDTVQTISTFKGIAADAEIEFRLAQRDPNGACTNGIDRINTPLTNDGTSSSKINQWNPAYYLNIWVVNAISNPAGAAGYASTPGYGSQVPNDGIVIVHPYVGRYGQSSPDGIPFTTQYTTEHALGHEVGHYLNLQHTWGATNSPEVGCGDDLVSDTPITKGHANKCPTNDQTCTPGITENVQNFMEYSYCSTMFTTGQKTRMRALLNSSTWSRSTIWQSSTLSYTGADNANPQLCNANFYYTNDTICPGNTVTFTDASWNATPTSWSWTFPGGTPSTSTLQNPVVTYNTPGVYSASLTAGKSSTNVSTTKSSIIYVGALATNATTKESFESMSLPSSTWAVANSNSGSQTWQKTTSAGATGTASAYLNNFNNNASQTDDIITPPFDMTKLTTPVLRFKVAYAQKASGSNDKLQVFMSYNCGDSWDIKYTKSGSQLAANSGGVTATNFVPTANQWRQETINITSPYTTKDNLLFRFRFTSGSSVGNNIYIDDINVDFSNGIANLDNSNLLDFKVYPNPIQSNTVVSFNLIDKEKVNLSVFDVLGRNVNTLANSELSAGEYTYPVQQNSNLGTGVYFVKLTVGDKQYIQKMIVE